MREYRDIFHLKYTLLVIYLVFTTHNYVEGGAVQLTSTNIEETLASNELVFINFYAEWCHFSKILQPIFDEAADEISKLFPEPNVVVMGKVNCENENTVASRFHITKYPTLKLFRNGQPSRKEYRGRRSLEAIVEFIKEQLDDPIQEFDDLKKLVDLDNKKRIIIGYFIRKDVPEYKNFKQVAMNLKDDCQFHVGFGEASQAMHPPEQPIIVFRPDRVASEGDDETFKGNLQNFDELNSWIQGKCVPLVREITFENAEELTEEGLPFLILFHSPEDTSSVKDYKEIIARSLPDFTQKVTFLTADGSKFEHPLSHLGKSKKDLPLIAIDSFKHMYLFNDFKDIYVSGKLKEFIDDLYSGKLHREYHYGPDEKTEKIGDKSEEKTRTDPPESTFKKLSPSKNRYTLLRDEL
ncbi:hypothetical protein HCN44_004004 [Aphidius gifuensis]|uniref:Thioredoxin domain-containing protein n=1 Tax=Aphidius gifuensis TaxID=684658 RepID=A0A835CSP4_APHGI|nr:endoplasmic reticulum resident protein 44 isoform X2 [Aphidius gifuensis]KAF7994532.1 hypothetical protein HCN44_004004 [Aphidius gifuensis]